MWIAGLRGIRATHDVVVSCFENAKAAAFSRRESGEEQLGECSDTAHSLGREAGTCDFVVSCFD